MENLSLTLDNVRWIERCAGRILAAEPELEHMAAVQHAFELCTGWPGSDPVEAADAFAAREIVVGEALDMREVVA